MPRSAKSPEARKMILDSARSSGRRAAGAEVEPMALRPPAKECSSLRIPMNTEKPAQAGLFLAICWLAAVQYQPLFSFPSGGKELRLRELNRWVP